MKNQIPNEMILHIPDDEQVATAGRLEAEMTYMKTKLEKELANAVYMYPDIVKTREQLFLFAFCYGRHYEQLMSGSRRVSPQVEGIFKQNRG